METFFCLVISFWVIYLENVFIGVQGLENMLQGKLIQQDSNLCFIYQKPTSDGHSGSYDGACGGGHGSSHGGSGDGDDDREEYDGDIDGGNNLKF